MYDLYVLCCSTCLSRGVTSKEETTRLLWCLYMSTNERKLKRRKRIWVFLLILLWTVLAVLLIYAKGDLSLEQILNYSPQDPFLAALGIIGLFILKSVDFILHSGVLYAATGILFDVIPALILNLLGLLIIVTPTYWLGRHYGSPAREYLTDKYPKLKLISAVRLHGDWIRVMLIRLLGAPLLAANLYFGAVNCPFREYMHGSVLGILPQMICFTIIGSKISEPGSVEFIVATVLQGIEFAGSLLIYSILLKRQRSDKDEPEHKNSR